MAWAAPHEQIRVVHLDLGRDAAPEPVGDALDPAVGYVVPEEFGNPCGAAEAFDELCIVHDQHLNMTFTPLSTWRESTICLNLHNALMADIHPTMARLFECVIDATKGSDDPVRTLAELRDRLAISSGRFTNWKSRGISKEGALAAEAEFGCSASWVLSGASASKDIETPATQAKTVTKTTVRSNSENKGGHEGPEPENMAPSAAIVPRSAVFSPTNLSSAIYLMANLLQKLDKRSRKTMGEWLVDLAGNPYDEGEVQDIALKAEGLARTQRISNNSELNAAFNGRGAEVETAPAPLEPERHR